MSRIGKQPVAILDGVQVKIDGNTILVEGPKGKLDYQFRPEVGVEIEDNQVHIKQVATTRETSAYQGLTRSLIKNMIEGVKNGYEKKLEVVGVGYVASISGKTLTLRVGYANEIKKEIPTGLDVTCPDQTHINVTGCDKQMVGQFAAEVRAARKPEPYNGKGVRYLGEYVKIKPG